MTTVVFAANNDNYRKRKRVHRACQQCKKHRRRCEPDLNGTGRCSSCGKYRLECSLSELEYPSPSTSTDVDLNHPSPETPHTRFVGDLNPEVVFITSSRPTTEIQRDLTECGVFDQPQADTASPGSSTSRASPNYGTSQPTPTSAKQTSNSRSSISPAYHTYLQSIRAFDLPGGPRVVDGLVDLYIRDIHPLFPILDVEKFMEERQRDVVSLTLLLAVCLVSIKHPEAEKWIPAGKTKRNWATRVAEQIEALLNGKIETDRLTLIRIHLLLSLHTEGPGGNETSSLHISTALHHAYTLGLHLNRPPTHRTNSEFLLWWNLWALDAIQAIICGRPLGIRRGDIGLPFPTDLSIPLPLPFQTLIRITEVLMKVISLYRPKTGTIEWEGPWPSFPDSDFPDNPQGDVLKLYYLSVCMLSVRSFLTTDGSATRKPCPTPSAAGQKCRTESAMAVLEFCRDKRKNGWLPLPIVPYTVALALSVFYSTLQSCSGSVDGFWETCGLLEGMAETWWFAGAIAGIGRMAGERVRAMEPVVSRRLNRQSESVSASDGAENGSGRVVDLEGYGVGKGMLRTAQEDTSAYHEPVSWDTGFTGVYDFDQGMGGDEWFLQLFPEIVVPVDFWRGLEIDVAN
ncbi:hypothetical protein EX30DRAFT_340320 [Ascodesmis nigricans]|uniref:Zn(2)-C6 fungal-type domain-containing protein n=1 Tax=Ascodesmis nigricans TaxID=341454 RepID=A0A4V3SIY2_9PEZI|nr:hypothetical protein EX30DRAFT_340320 [Ascodesmis nigricans]